jgi:hypothetical protein
MKFIIQTNLNNRLLAEADSHRELDLKVAKIKLADGEFAERIYPADTVERVFNPVVSLDEYVEAL